MRRGLLVPALSLLVLLAVDLMQAVRPSGLAAAACAATLFRSKPDAQSLVARYRDAIADQARRYDLPAELVAAIVVDHQSQLSSYRAFTDCLGSALGANLSLGLAQVRLSTGARLDGKRLGQLSGSEYRALRSRLLDPESNIAYAARELRALRDRPNRYPGMPADALIDRPDAMALLITEYRMGRLSTSSETSRLGINAFSALGLIEDGTLDRFGRNVNDTRRMRAASRAYLTDVYCRRGMFNQGVCDHWQRAHVVEPP